MIVFDTETTGLVEKLLIPLDQQPEIIEFSAIKLDDTTLVEQDIYTTLIRPHRLPLPPKITQITGITDGMVKPMKPFASHVINIAEFFLGQRGMVAHNVEFDRNMLSIELQRLGLLMHFPWPIDHICTVERSSHLFPKWPTLDRLYEHFVGTPRTPGAHRGLKDARDLAACVRVMRGEGLL